MPRVLKDISSLKRTENTRSYSQETSSISSLIAREQNFIKKFAVILWEILEKSSSSQEVNKSKQILLKMMNKELSLQEIIQQITGKDNNLLNSNMKRYVHLTPLKEKSSKRKYSEPLSILTQSKKKSRLSFTQLRV